MSEFLAQPNLDQPYVRIHAILAVGRDLAYQAVNAAMVAAYWGGKNGDADR